ncbi:MAG: hypothetical protein M3R24_38755, partial [Chloroflexota bacterium]|nr:hypothetical protein [Chloroflexota bacterium]
SRFRACGDLRRQEAHDERPSGRADPQEADIRGREQQGEQRPQTGGRLGHGARERRAERRLCRSYVKPPID